MTKLFKALLVALSIIQASASFAEDFNGRRLYLQRCAMCHGSDLRGTGPLAKKEQSPNARPYDNLFQKSANCLSRCHCIIDNTSSEWRLDPKDFEK
jgi:mono/diheme cytochrome c family protein